MLWRMSADSRPRRLGVMSSHRISKACGEPPSRPAAGSHQPVPQTPTGSANCPIALSRQFPAPPHGGKEFPVAERPSCAISCRVVSKAGRSTDGRSPIPVAGIAKIPDAQANFGNLPDSPRENAAPNLGNLPNLGGRPAGRRHVGKRLALTALIPGKFRDATPHANFRPYPRWERITRRRLIDRAHLHVAAGCVLDGGHAAFAGHA